MDRGKDKRKREKQKGIYQCTYCVIIVSIITAVIMSYINKDILLAEMILIIITCIMVSIFVFVYISKWFKRKMEEDRKKRVLIMRGGK